MTTTILLIVAVLVIAWYVFRVRRCLVRFIKAYNRNNSIFKGGIDLILKNQKEMFDSASGKIKIWGEWRTPEQWQKIFEPLGYTNTDGVIRNKAQLKKELVAGGYIPADNTPKNPHIGSKFKPDDFFMEGTTPPKMYMGDTILVHKYDAVGGIYGNKMRVMFDHNGYYKHNASDTVFKQKGLWFYPDTLKKVGKK